MLNTTMHQVSGPTSKIPLAVPPGPTMFIVSITLNRNR